MFVTKQHSSTPSAAWTPAIRVGVLALLLLACAPLALAEQVLHFTNGTTMPIVTHVMRGDMIHVDLGGNGFMAFPRNVIESIEETDAVELKPSTVQPGTKRSVMMATSRTAPGNRNKIDRPVDRRAQMYNPANRTAMRGRQPERDQHGNSVETPLRGNGRAAERLKQIVRNNSISNTAGNGNIRGARRVGGRYVLDPGTTGARRGRPVGVELRRTAPPQQPTPQSDDN